MEIDLDSPKPSQISKYTLYLPKEKGGTNLIDFQNKMKAFRILLVFKYLNCHDKAWTSILRYWYAANIYSISGQRWNNCYPHAQDITNIPPFFKKCLIEFKDYYNKHGRNLNHDTTSKEIYCNLIEDRNHKPAAILKYPEMGIYLNKLPKYSFLDPYLRQFLYKLYHCRLYFKRYRLNINDMLNFGQRCILCNNAIDTPVHLFENCEKGSALREKRDNLIQNYNLNNFILSQDNKVYSVFDTSSQEKTIQQYIITATNYTIYRIKMKKFYDRSYVVTNEEAMYSFINRLKLRIICDHKRLSIGKFMEFWDPNENQLLFRYNERKINCFNF